MILRIYVGLFFGFILLPILVVVAMSFTSAGYIGFPLPGMSLRWFYRIYEYRPFLNSFLVSIELALVSTSIACTLGVPAALALGRWRNRRADALTTFLMSPLSIPQIVLGFGLLFYLSRLSLGVSFASLVLAHTVIAIPYVVRTVLGVHRGVPVQLEEAAAILGADRWRIFRHITLPQVRPGIGAGALFCMLISLDNLPISYFFGSPATNTLPVVMLSYLENQFDPSIAAVSVVQMGLAVAALAVVEWTYGLSNMTAPV